jgi:hypothetical protein
METRLNTLCTRFGENKIGLEDFLKAIGQNIEKAIIIYFILLIFLFRNV